MAHAGVDGAGAAGAAQQPCPCCHYATCVTELASFQSIANVVKIRRDRDKRQASGGAVWHRVLCFVRTLPTRLFRVRRGRLVSVSCGVSATGDHGATLRVSRRAYNMRDTCTSPRSERCDARVYTARRGEDLRHNIPAR